MQLQLKNKWTTFVISLLLVTVSYFLTQYFVLYRLTDPDLFVLIYELSLIIIATLLSFLILGLNKRVRQSSGNPDVNNIFKVICITTILLLTFSIVNRALDIEPALVIPLTTIVLFNLFSFSFIAIWRYIF